MQDIPTQVKNKKPVYSKKSQFGADTVDHLEMRSMLGRSQPSDAFSIVDLEFRKVELLRAVKVKAQETEEQAFAGQSLQHQLEAERR